MEPSLAWWKILEPIVAIWHSSGGPGEMSWNLLGPFGIPQGSWGEVLETSLAIWDSSEGPGTWGEVLEPSLAICDSPGGPGERAWNLVWPFGIPQKVLGEVLQPTLAIF